VTAVEFDVKACRQWLELFPTPPRSALDLSKMWSHLVSDIEAACDEIERLRGEKAA